VGSSPISISPVLSNLQRRYILGAGSSQISDLHLQSPISNVVILGRIQSDLRSPSPISNLQSPISIRGPGGGGGLKPSRRCAMDSFTMQKDLHPLFAPFCNLQSAHTISRRLWREVRISTSVARSQATARTKREISDSSRASTPEKICLHQFFNLLLLLAGDLPLKRSLKGIYDLQSKDLPMLRRDVHVWWQGRPAGADRVAFAVSGPRSAVV